MTVSKFDELQSLAEEDYKNTLLYVENNFKFIEIIIKKIIQYLGCQSSNISILNDNDKPIHIENNFRHAVTIEHKGFFNFKLLIMLVDRGFNINNCGRSFAENLLPPSGIVLDISTKRIDEQGFITIAPLKTTKDEEIIVGKEFSITINDDSSYSEFLESCFNNSKNFIKGGLEERIAQFLPENNRDRKPVIGFQLPPTKEE